MTNETHDADSMYVKIESNSVRAEGFVEDGYLSPDQLVSLIKGYNVDIGGEIKATGDRDIYDLYQSNLFFIRYWHNLSCRILEETNPHGIFIGQMAATNNVKDLTVEYFRYFIPGFLSEILKKTLKVPGENFVPRLRMDGLCILVALYLYDFLDEKSTDSLVAKSVLSGCIPLAYYVGSKNSYLYSYTLDEGHSFNNKAVGIIEKEFDDYGDNVRLKYSSNLLAYNNVQMHYDWNSAGTELLTKYLKNENALDDESISYLVSLISSVHLDGDTVKFSFGENPYNHMSITASREIKVKLPQFLSHVFNCHYEVSVQLDAIPRKTLGGERTIEEFHKFKEPVIKHVENDLLYLPVHILFESESHHYFYHPLRCHDDGTAILCRMSLTSAYECEELTGSIYSIFYESVVKSLRDSEEFL